jgi:hypothetical protein
MLEYGELMNMAYFCILTIILIVEMALVLGAISDSRDESEQDLNRAEELLKTRLVQRKNRDYSSVPIEGIWYEKWSDESEIRNGLGEYIMDFPSTLIKHTVFGDEALDIMIGRSEQSVAFDKQRLANVSRKRWSVLGFVNFMVVFWLWDFSIELLDKVAK